MAVYVVRMPMLIGTREVADLLGCSRRDVVRLVERERLTPAQKLPSATGAYLFDPADVGALADELATPAPEATDATDPLPSDGAPAGGRAGDPEPAPASTTDEVAR